jgi:spectinomycin phosphotransferase
VDLLGRVREDFGIPLIGVRPTGLGADPRASLFRGVTADGTAYAVKSGSAPQPGLVVADFLAGRGVRGVPAPVRTRTGGLVATDDDRTVSVVPWVDGDRAIEVGLTAAQWRSLGELLATVHATAPGPPLVGVPPGLRVDRHDPSSEVGRARAFPRQLAAAVAQAPSDPLLAELAAVWDTGGQRVLEVAALAVSTARSSVWAGTEPVVCHADPHHGNLLLEPDTFAGAGDGVWLVDWDDAVLAPREADLIFVVGGVFSFAPITSSEVDSFFEGYTPASGGVTRRDLDPTRLTHYRSTRALTDFLDFADDVLDLALGADPGRDGDVGVGPAGDPCDREAGRAAALRIATGALSPEGLVTITLSEAAAGH